MRRRTHLLPEIFFLSLLMLPLHGCADWIAGRSGDYLASVRQFYSELCGALAPHADGALCGAFAGCIAGAAVESRSIDAEALCSESVPSSEVGGPDPAFTWSELEQAVQCTNSGYGVQQCAARQRCLADGNSTAECEIGSPICEQYL